jgi:hypothetical protein
MDELRALSEKATQGEWRCDKYDTRQFIFQVQKDLDRDDRIAYVYGGFADKEQEAIPNAAFIVACVNYVRKMLAQPVPAEGAQAVTAEQVQQAYHSAKRDDHWDPEVFWNNMAQDINAALAAAPPVTAAPAEPVSWKGVKWRDSIKATDLAAEIALHFAHDCEDSMCGEDADESNCETAWIESKLSDFLDQQAAAPPSTPAERVFCEAIKDSFVCNLRRGHDGDHMDLDGSGGCVGWSASTPASDDEPIPCPTCGSIECCGLNCGPTG